MGQLMWVLNITPDSFSDCGRCSQIDNALYQAEKMINNGADIIDVGGESTRPNAKKISLDEETHRVIPVIEKLVAEFDTLISIDTSKAGLMSHAIAVGVGMINDVRALQAEGALEACQQANVLVCLMHMQGTPETMQKKPEYVDIIQEVSLFFTKRITVCENAGIKRERLLLDPGFGFGKTLEHNLQLLAHLPYFTSFKQPLLVGLSRKSMLGTLLNDAPVTGRLHASVSAAVIAALKGAAIIRVHDVKETVEALKIVQGVQHYE
jgi:dihydropteroate synthase